MPTPHDRLDARLAAIEGALAGIESRLRLLEAGSPPQSAVHLFERPMRAPDAAAIDISGTLTLIGRTFVIFAGAYLLRAVTEAGVVDRTTGAVIGLAYGVAWTAVAYRVAPRHPLSATFFGACTVLVGFPLLWEATTRFALLTPTVGTWVLAAITGMVLATAWRRHLHALAWLATIGACGLATVLLVTTGVTLPFTVFLIVLGVATLWLGYDRDWTHLRWFTAFLADLAVLGLVGRALATPPRDAPSQVLLVELLLLVGYLGSIAIRTLVRGRDVIPFEAVQTGAVLLAGLAGALLISHRTGAGALTLGPTLLVLSLACYGVAFADRWHARGANYYFYTTLAIVFALTGGQRVVNNELIGILWVSMAILAGWAGSRYQRTTLAVHSIVYVIAAAIVSGLVATALVGLFATVEASWSAIGAGTWAVLAGLGLCWLVSAPPPDDSAWRVGSVLRAILAVLIVGCIAGVGVISVRALLALVDTPIDAGILATLRTGVLAGAATVVAWLGRRLTTREYGVVLYPILAWGGLKLLLEDFRTSPPSLLVVALALYGGALILGPRIAKADRRGGATA